MNEIFRFHHEDGEHTHPHEHGHSHSHEGCDPHDCAACGSCDPMQETVALLQYMVNHNAAHANELAQRGFVVLTFDPSYHGYSGGQPRMVPKAHGASSFQTGSVTLTRVPLPGSLSMRSALPWAAAMRWQSASARPLPP